MADPPVQSFAEALRARPDSRSQATADAAVACPQAAAAARMSTVACDGADVGKADSIATFKLTFFCVCVWAVAKAAGAKAAGKVAAGP
jgi:hypothetical protein